VDADALSELAANELARRGLLEEGSIEAEKELETKWNIKDIYAQGKNILHGVAEETLPGYRTAREGGLQEFLALPGHTPDPEAVARVRAERPDDFYPKHFVKGRKTYQILKKHGLETKASYMAHELQKLGHLAEMVLYGKPTTTAVRGATISPAPVMREVETFVRRAYKTAGKELPKYVDMAAEKGDVPIELLEHAARGIVKGKGAGKAKHLEELLDGHLLKFDLVKSPEYLKYGMKKAASLDELSRTANVPHEGKLTSVELAKRVMRAKQGIKNPTGKEPKASATSTDAGIPKPAAQTGEGIPKKTRELEILEEVTASPFGKGRAAEKATEETAEILGYKSGELLEQAMKASSDEEMFKLLKQSLIKKGKEGKAVDVKKLVEEEKLITESTEEFIKAGRGTKLPYQGGEEEAVTGLATAEKMDRVAMENAEAIAKAPYEKVYGGGPSTAEVTGFVNNAINSKLAQRAQRFVQSPEFVSKDPAWKRFIKGFGEMDVLRNRMIAKLTHNYPSKFSKAEKNLIGEALENPAIKLPERLAAAKEYYRSVYDATLEMFIRQNTATEAEYHLVKKLGESLRGRKFSPKAIQEEHHLSDDAMHALEVFRNKKDFYLPHVFDKDVLRAALEDEKLALLASKKGSAKNLQRIEESLKNLNGGKLILWESVPKSVQSRHFKIRTGKKGYSLDADRAFKSYLSGWTKEMYTKKGLKLFHEEYHNMSPEVQQYAREFVKDYLGLAPRQPVASTIRLLEWVRTLGFSPPAAFVNNLQKINTIYDAGPIWSAKGYLKGLTKEGKELFNLSGLKNEASEVLYLGDTNKHLETFRRATGWLFKKVEEGNRKHAFNTYYLKAMEKHGMAAEDAYWYAVNGTYKTQFRYGKMGMPNITRGWSGTFSQYISYPIKSAEFFQQLWREPKGITKALGWLGVMEGGRLTVQELLDVDLSNQLGIGINYGEAIKMMQSASKEEWAGMWGHSKLMFAQGTGMLPTGPGPFTKLLAAIPESAYQLSLSPLKRELTPIAYNRFRQMIEAFANREGDEYPIYNTVGLLGYNKGRRKIMYKLNLRDVLSRTFGPKPVEETRQRVKTYTHNLSKQIRDDLTRNIADAFAEQDIDRVETYLGKYGYLGVWPSIESVDSAIDNKTYSNEERIDMQPYGVRQQFKEQMFNE